MKSTTFFYFYFERDSLLDRIHGLKLQWHRMASILNRMNPSFANERTRMAKAKLKFSYENKSGGK